MKQHKTIYITGKVQGVGFRMYVLSQAQLLGITGTLSNQDNGSVHAEVEGTRDVLRKLVSVLKTGPSYAKVEDIHIEEHPVEGYNNFVIIG